MIFTQEKTPDKHLFNVNNNNDILLYLFLTLNIFHIFLHLFPVFPLLAMKK